MKNILALISLFIITIYAFADNYTYIKGPMLVKSNAVTSGTATTTLTATSNMVQVFAGLTHQTVILPNTASLPTGSSFEIQNISSDYVTVRDNSLTILQRLKPVSSMRFDLVSGTWNYFPLQGKELYSASPIVINQDASSATFSLSYTPEDVSNKSTSTSLGTSDTLYPSQNAVK